MIRAPPPPGSRPERGDLLPFHSPRYGLLAHPKNDTFVLCTRFATEYYRHVGQSNIIGPRRVGDGAADAGGLEGSTVGFGRGTRFEAVFDVGEAGDAGDVGDVGDVDEMGPAGAPLGSTDGITDGIVDPTPRGVGSAGPGSGWRGGSELGPATPLPAGAALPLGRISKALPPRMAIPSAAANTRAALGPRAVGPAGTAWETAAVVEFATPPVDVGRAGGTVCIEISAREIVGGGSATGASGALSGSTFMDIETR